MVKLQFLKQLSWITACLFLLACGQMGPLELPEKGELPDSSESENNTEASSVPLS